MFDAVNSIDGGYTAYRAHSRLHGAREAAAAQAAHDVLTALPPAGRHHDAALATRLAKLHPARATRPQVGRGRQEILNGAARTAGRRRRRSHRPRCLACGNRRPRPCRGGFRTGGDAKPFALPTLLLLPRRPLTLNSQNTRMANVIKAIGGVNSTAHAEQTLQARLWASVGYKELWSGVWNQVTRSLARDRKLSLIESARLFALVNVAMQDGVQTAQASKYAYQLWRPVHAIQRAGEDMNPATDADPTWMPLLTTPYRLMPATWPASARAQLERWP